MERGEKGAKGASVARGVRHDIFFDFDMLDIENNYNPIRGIGEITKVTNVG